MLAILSLLFLCLFCHTFATLLFEIMANVFFLYFLLNAPCSRTYLTVYRQMRSRWYCFYVWAIYACSAYCNTNDVFKQNKVASLNFLRFLWADIKTLKQTGTITLKQWKLLTLSRWTTTKKAFTLSSSSKYSETPATRPPLFKDQRLWKLPLHLCVWMNP